MNSDTKIIVLKYSREKVHKNDKWIPLQSSLKIREKYAIKRGKEAIEAGRSKEESKRSGRMEVDELLFLTVFFAD